MIAKNEVFQYVNNDNGERLRVVHLSGDNIYYVNIDAVSSMPQKGNIEKLETEYANKILIRIPDPYLTIYTDNELTDIQKEKRDKDWIIVTKYLTEYEDELLSKNKREGIFTKIAEENNLSISKVRKIFARFWQRGMTKNALIPDYTKSGARGKERKLIQTKVGRPRKTNYAGESTTGINITEDIKKIIEISIEKFYRRKKLTIKETYNQMLKYYFSDKIPENGELKYIVFNETRIPSYHQFYHWFRKFKDVKKDMIFRESSKAFELTERPTTSNSTIETDGPGTRFQIDATVADIYLLSSLNRNRIIGRPVVYAVMDVYSRLVTGIYVGLEGPSWTGAMMALDNMISEKVEFCREYGITVTNDQWPAQHLPEIILADRGEFEGHLVENLINNLGIRIENTPPYRGDLKGIVERNFRTTNEKIKRKAPGAIEKEFRERGDRDYRLDATLTLEEFTRILIKLVLRHNHHIIGDYPMDTKMITDELTPTPINLWNWGIKNRKGRLRTIDKEIMRLNILPKGSAHISRAGLKFKKLFYSSQIAIEEQWFIKSKRKSTEVVYDPRNLNQIYILHEDGRNYEVFYLLEKDEQYRNCRLEEILFQQELREELAKKQTHEQINLDINLDKEIEEIIKDSIKKKEMTIQETTSKSKVLKGIKENRRFEKEINRKKEAFEIGKEEKEGIVKPFNKKSVEKDDIESDTRRLTLMEKIRKQRDEDFGKE